MPPTALPRIGSACRRSVRQRAATARPGHAATLDEVTTRTSSLAIDGSAAIGPARLDVTTTGLRSGEPVGESKLAFDRVLAIEHLSQRPESTIFSAACHILARQLLTADPGRGGVRCPPSRHIVVVHSSP